MKKSILLCIILIVLLGGCTKINYSKEFAGVPIYPGTSLLSNNQTGDVTIEMYVDMSFNGDVEKVKNFFEKNIDDNIWSIAEITEPLSGHNVDVIYGYRIKSKDSEATLTIAYTNSDKVGRNISITIMSDRTNQNLPDGK